MASECVWIETPENCPLEVAFVPGEIVSADADFSDVKISLSLDGSKKDAIQRVPNKQIRQRFKGHDRDTCADNTALVHMNDASILENLQRRHAQDLIYTYTASVLLAVNPYKVIDGLYGEAQCRLYRGKHLGALPPHPYAISDTAYRLLVRENINQALLISGESGAGKTETAKLVVEYLAYASGTASDLASKVQSRVVQSQPILESFGNAATLRNSNSSRFGKYNRVFFDSNGTLVDAGVTTYLLESSRVVIHGEGERTYHVFYEMLQGLPDTKLKSLHLDPSRSYRLMHNTRPVVDFEDRDKQNFERLCTAFKTIGLSQEDVDACLQILAGLVHLADIPKEDVEVEMASRATEEDEETRCVEVNADSVSHAAELLGMDCDELCATLQRRKIQIPGRDSFHEAARSPIQFRHALHSLIKALYKRLFEQMVRRINDSFAELRPQKDKLDAWNSIGILDIYGFERLQRNSFEQLCINLANERLQQYFVENVLVAEQQLYKREGLPWTGMTLPNSEPVVSCIGYIFKTLDDFSGRLAKGFGEAQQVSDDRFCERVLKEVTQDPQRKDILKAPKVSAKNARASIGSRANEAFVITHYAGPVEYTTKGWLDKNNDRLLVECEDLVSSSRCTFVAAMADEDNKQTFRSISCKYSKDLEALLQTLSEANLHYIRCFKPNALQKPDIFNGKLVLDQIVQCGTIELVKIMHDGFPNRCNFEELYNRFKTLLPEDFQRYGMRTFIEALMLAYEVPRKEWALGMSRLFLKAGQLKALEDMRAEGAVPKSENLQKILKQIIRKRWSRACLSVQLCNWLPKMLREVYVKRAASTLTGAALVTSRLALRLEAARQRVAQRRLAMRRRLGAAFRTVFCLRVAWRQLREQRRNRVSNALHQYYFIAKRTSTWLEKARASLHDAALRRQREEQRRLEELEKKMEAEETRLKLEMEKRREEEEERFRLEAEKQKQEEAARLQAEAEKHDLEEKARQQAQAEQQQQEDERRLAFEQEQLAFARKMEEERQEAQRLREEEQNKLAAERARMEEERREFAEQMRVEKENLAKQMQEAMAEQMKSHAEMMAAERQRMAEEMAASREEHEAHLKESMLDMQERSQDAIRRLSIAQQSSASGAEADVGHTFEIKELVQDEVSRIMACQSEKMVEKFDKVRRQIKAAQADEAKLTQKLDSSPLSNSPMTTPRANGSCSKKGRRHSIAHEALLNPSRDEAHAQNKQRKWWAEHRNFLMEDLYHASPTPARNSRKRQSVGNVVQARTLGPEFDEANAARNAVAKSSVPTNAAA